MLWVQSLLHYLGIDFPTPMQMYCDNQVANLSQAISCSMNVPKKLRLTGTSFRICWLRNRLSLIMFI